MHSSGIPPHMWMGMFVLYNEPVNISVSRVLIKLEFVFWVFFFFWCTYSRWSVWNSVWLNANITPVIIIPLWLLTLLFNSRISVFSVFFGIIDRSFPLILPDNESLALLRLIWVDRSRYRVAYSLKSPNIAFKYVTPNMPSALTQRESRSWAHCWELLFLVNKCKHLFLMAHLTS